MSRRVDDHRKTRRTPSEPQGGDRGAEQVHHDEIGQLEIGIHQRGGAGAARRDREHRPIALPPDRGRGAAGPGTSRAGGVWVSRCAMTEMSKPRPRRTSSVVVEWRNHARQRLALRFADHDSESRCAGAHIRAASRRPTRRRASRFRHPAIRRAAGYRCADCARFRTISELRCLDGDHEPLGVERVGKALADAHQLLGLAVHGDRDQEPIAREPGTRSRRMVRKLESRGVYAICGAAQREFAQREQFDLRKNLSVAVPTRSGA
jgi:hypothetical protein